MYWVTFSGEIKRGDLNDLTVETIAHSKASEFIASLSLSTEQCGQKLNVVLWWFSSCNCNINLDDVVL